MCFYMERTNLKKKLKKKLLKKIPGQKTETFNFGLKINENKQKHVFYLI